MPFHPLVPHSTTPCEALRCAARVRRTAEGPLAIEYFIEGDLTRLRLPEPAPPRPADGLWRHTCCEAFVAGQGQAAYHELNFAPSGQWAIYRFAAYRAGMSSLSACPAPRLTLRRDDTRRLALTAVIDPAALPAVPAGAGLRLALAAVLETRDGRLCYLALAHPPGQPDFHHRDGFTLELDPAGGA